MVYDRGSSLHKADKLRMLRLLAQVALVNELQAILDGAFIVHGAAEGQTGLKGKARGQK